MTRVSIVGGTGYVAGELLRLLLPHPDVEVGQVVSRSRAGRYVHATHPHLRGFTDLRFCAPDALEPADILFLALPQGKAAGDVERYAELAERIIDASADFRLPAEDFARWYGGDHPNPAWIDRFVYGLPELHRDAVRTTKYASGVGCNATAVNLALLPLARAGLLGRSPIVAEVKVGSSEAGREPGASSHHPDRAGVVRSYAPVDHRHTAEVRHALDRDDVHLSITAVERVRGALATAQVFVDEPLDERALWSAYRECTADEPFLRVVHERTGGFRHPDPKTVVGSNFADVGFAIDKDGRRVVAIAAIDNLMKGAAGTAVQCMNLMLGIPETTGLWFPSPHPA